MNTNHFHRFFSNFSSLSCPALAPPPKTVPANAPPLSCGRLALQRGEILRRQDSAPAPAPAAPHPASGRARRRRSRNRRRFRSSMRGRKPAPIKKTLAFKPLTEHRREESSRAACSGRPRRDPAPTPVPAPAAPVREVVDLISSPAIRATPCRENSARARRRRCCSCCRVRPRPAPAAAAAAPVDARDRDQRGDGRENHSPQAAGDGQGPGRGAGSQAVCYHQELDGPPDLRQPGDGAGNARRRRRFARSTATPSRPSAAKRAPASTSRKSSSWRRRRR